MSLKQSIKIEFMESGAIRDAIPFQDIKHARAWTKNEAKNQYVRVNNYGRYSWDVINEEYKTILHIRFY